MRLPHLLSFDPNAEGGTMWPLACETLGLDAETVAKARDEFSNTMGNLCAQALPSQAVVPLIPDLLPWGGFAALDFVPTKDAMLIRLCNDLTRHRVLYQTPIPVAVWQDNKDKLCAAENKLRRACVPCLS